MLDIGKYIVKVPVNIIKNYLSDKASDSEENVEEIAKILEEKHLTSAGKILEYIDMSKNDNIQNLLLEQTINIYTAFTFLNICSFFIDHHAEYTPIDGRYAHKLYLFALRDEMNNQLSYIEKLTPENTKSTLSIKEANSHVMFGYNRQLRLPIITPKITTIQNAYTSNLKI